MPLMRQTTYIVAVGADAREGRRDYCRPVPSVRIRLRGARKGSLRIASTRHDSPRNVKALERPRRPDGAIRSDCPARGRGRGPALITTLWYVLRLAPTAHIMARCRARRAQSNLPFVVRCAAPIGDSPGMTQVMPTSWALISAG